MNDFFSRRFSASLAASAETPESRLDLARGKVIAPVCSKAAGVFSGV